MDPASPGDSLVIEESPAPKTFKIPVWCRILLLVAVVWCTFLIYPYIFPPKLPPMNVKGIDKPSKAEASRLKIYNSQSYAEKLAEYTEQKTQIALDTGSSFIPPVTSKEPLANSPNVTPKPEIKDEPPKPRPEAKPETKKPLTPPNKPKLPPKTLDPAKVQSMIQALNQYLGPGTYSPPQVLVLNLPRSKIKPQNEPNPLPKKSQALKVKPGDLLYALNRLSLNSDAPGPAMAEVILGPLKGAKFLGSFARLETHLTLRFQRLVLPDGQEYELEAYAVDPKTDRTAIASSVDHHYLERFGGLVAASFIEGLGEALKTSGQTTYHSPYSTTTVSPHYDLKEQLGIASAKVGQRTANLLSQNFNRVPTVSLASGCDLAILIIKVNAK